MKTPKTLISKNIFAAALAAGLFASSAHAAVYTWNGSANDGDWNNAANWTGGIPEGGDILTDQSHQIIIDGTSSKPSVNVPTFFNGGSTPRFILSGGATLDLEINGGNQGTGANDGEVANVSGANTHLKLTGSGMLSLNREFDGTNVWNVHSGGTVTISGPDRVDLGYASSRTTEINLNNGTFNIIAQGANNSFFGSTHGMNLMGTTTGIQNVVTLDAGSVFNVDGIFNGNFSNGGASGDEAVVNFNFLDTGSVVYFDAGGAYNTIVQVNDLLVNRGVFTTSLAGGSIDVTLDGGTGIFTVSAIPEPGSYALLAGLAGLLFVMARRIHGVPARL